MICPECRDEFREGITCCPDCAVDLVQHLDPSDFGDPFRRIDLVTVLESGNPALLAVAESLLEAERIVYLKSGDRLQDLFGAGRLGLGLNPIVGPVKIQVEGKDADRARDLLAFTEEDRSQDGEY